MVETSQDWRVLWLGVIFRAQEEAEGRYTYWDEFPEKTKYNARKWLTKMSKGLCEVGSLAGLSTEQIKRLVEDMKEKYGTGN